MNDITGWISEEKAVQTGGCHTITTGEEQEVQMLWCESSQAFVADRRDIKRNRMQVVHFLQIWKDFVGNAGGVQF